MRQSIFKELKRDTQGNLYDLVGALCDFGMTQKQKESLSEYDSQHLYELEQEANYEFQLLSK